MTVKELIAQEEKKHYPKEIGDHIALNVWEEDKEVYLEHCRMATGLYDYHDLINAKVKGYSYEYNYGNIGVIKLNVEVKE